MFNSTAKRLFWITIAISVLFLQSLLLFTMSGTRKALLEQKEADLSLLLSRSSDYLTLYSEGLSTNLLSLSNALQVIGEDPDSIAKALISWQKSNPGKVQTVACIFEDGDVLCNRMSSYSIFGGPTFQQCYREAYSSSYRGIRWTEPYTSALTLSRTVALYRPIPLGTQKAVVLIELDLSSMLSRLLQSGTTPALIWSVVSSQGNLVATSDDYTLSTTAPSRFSRAQLEPAAPEIRATITKGAYCFGSEDYTILTDTPVCMGWTLAALTPTSELYNTIQPLLYQTIIISSLHLLLLALAVALLGHFFTKPLTQIAKKILTETSPLSLRLPEYTGKRNELGVLARSIESLIDRSQELLEQQKEMLEQQRRLEIDMLQAQIHPHFLGNTLACIQSLVKEGQLTNVETALQSLVRLLNYSIARTDETATLGDEMKCLQAYIVLRQMRSSYPFNYMSHVPEHHLTHPVPRLFLQPIVENAILHGLAGMDTPGLIAVTSYERNGKLFLCVDDNGVGITPERLEEINHGAVEPSVHSHGIGINNVFRRLRLVYPDSTGCSIDQKPGGGVRVILDLGRIEGSAQPLE